MNLIFSNGELKSTKFSCSETYSFDQITFFIEKKYVNLQFYCVVKDHTGKIDLLRLKQTNSTSASYYNYVCSMDFPTKAKDGKCTISLFGIDPATGSIEVSTPNFELNVKMISTISRLKFQCWKNSIRTQLISIIKFCLCTMVS